MKIPFEYDIDGTPTVFWFEEGTPDTLMDEVVLGHYRSRRASGSPILGTDENGLFLGQGPGAMSTDQPVQLPGSIQPGMEPSGIQRMLNRPRTGAEPTRVKRMVERNPLLRTRQNAPTSFQAAPGQENRLGRTVQQVLEGSRPSSGPNPPTSFQAAEEQPEVGAVTRFLRGAGEELIPSQEGVRHMMAHPIGMVAGAYQEQLNQLSQADRTIRAFRQTPSLSGASEAVGQTTAAALPLLGPPAANIGESFEEGDLARSLGRTTGFLSPFTLAGMRRIQTPQEFVPSRFRKSYGQRVGKFRVLESTVRGIPGATGVFQKIEEINQVRATQIMNELIDSVDSRGRFADTVDVMDAFSRGVEKVIPELESPAKVIYNRLFDRIDAPLKTRSVERVVERRQPGSLVDAQGKPTTVNVPEVVTERVSKVNPKTVGLKGFAEEIVQSIDDQKALMHPDDLARAERTLTKIMDAPETLPFKTFHDYRSDLLRVARSMDDPLPGKTGAIASYLAGLTDDAMETALIEGGHSNLLADLRFANEIWKHVHDTFTDRAMRRLIEMDPDKGAAVLAGAPRRVIRRLKSGEFSEALEKIQRREKGKVFSEDQIPEDVVREASALVLRDVFVNPSIKGFSDEMLEQFDVKSYFTGTQIPPMEGGLKLRGLESKLELARPRLADLIGQKQANELVGTVAELATLARATPKMSAVLAVSGVAIGPISGIAAGFMAGGGFEALWQGISTAGVTSTGIMGSAWLFARMLHSETVGPKVARTIRNLSRAVGRDDTRAAILALQRLDELAKEQLQLQEEPVQ